MFGKTYALEGKLQLRISFVYNQKDNFVFTTDFEKLLTVSFGNTEDHENI